MTRTATLRPTGEARITMYDVGFGDCFLLTVPYRGERARQVLIDCGSHQASTAHLTRVAEQVRADCGGKLDAIVVTHRHKDHLSAFGKEAPAKVFAGLAPDLAVQPWTEDPQADAQAEGPKKSGAPHLSVGAHLLGLAQAQEFAAELVTRLKSGSPQLHGASGRVQADLAAIAELSIANKQAITWLASVPKDREYLFAGAVAEKLGALLPGVGVRVLGPPTLRQTQDIRHEARSGGVEFWKLQQALAAAAGREAPTTDEGSPLFPAAPTVDPALASPQDRGAIERLHRVQLDNVQWIVRSLDEALNNTSLILLFTVGRHRLLFAGDAQVENWAYALSREDLVEGLQETSVYKVGHHGSGNATPRTMWGRLHDKRPARATLQSLLSTEGGAYPGVPAKSLLTALAKQSEVHSTVSLRTEGKLSETLVLK